jgi:uncharacterized repeat protein (TIGR01451 family)
VVLTTTLPDGIEFVDSTPPNNAGNPVVWKLGTLAPGKSARVELKALVKKTGVQLCKAEVKDDAGAKRETSQQVLSVEPKLTLTMTGPQQRLVGRQAIYTMTVANPGTAPVTNVEIIHDATNAKAIDREGKPVAGLPPVFVSASGGGKVMEAGVRWALGTLTPGTRQTVQLVVQGKQAGDFWSHAEARADRGLRASAEVKTTFDASAALNLELDKSTDPLEVSKTGTYTLRVVNQGTAPATNVLVKLTVPDELTVTEVKPQANAKIDGSVVTFGPLDTLAPGAEVVWTLAAAAQRPGDVRLRATLTADQLKTGPMTCEESTHIHGDTPPAMTRPPQ